MSRHRRPACRQITPPDPKYSSLHEVVQSERLYGLEAMCTERFRQCDSGSIGDCGERTGNSARLQTSQRARRRPEGCWILADQGLGQLPQKPMFWHLVNFPTRAEAEEAKGPRGTVLDALRRFGYSRSPNPDGRRPVGHVSPKSDRFQEFQMNNIRLITWKL